MSIDRLEELDDALDLALAAAGMVSDSGERIPLDDLLREFGFTRDELRQHPDYS